MTTVESAARTLGGFLRSRREQTRPDDLGLEPGPRRKVEGLRREEVAALAGLSADYYQRLEQGRNVRPSDGVIDSIADALDLDETERRHLVRLARATRRPPQAGRRTVDRVPANAKALLDATTLPALILSRFLDVLAWNDAAADLLGDPLGVPVAERNILHAVLRDETTCLSQADGEANARGYLGMLRAAVAHEPEHPRAVTLVGTLSVRSAAFRRLWARHEVREDVHGSHVVQHPRVGEIALEWDSYALRGTPGPILIVFTPAPGHESRLQLTRLASGR